LPSQRKKPRIYRTRVNPFEGVWEAEIVPLLSAMPSLQAITILRELQRRHPGQFPDNQLRTLQRHIRQWSGLCGPDRDVIFRQEHPPGAQGLSDFTDASELGVTLSGQTFPHRLYHFVPFNLLGLDTDNDSVFVNETVRDYCQAAGVVLTSLQIGLQLAPRGQ
jgi:hypothetical protein